MDVGLDGLVARVRSHVAESSNGGAEPRPIFNWPKKNDLPPGAVGKVAQTDRNTIVVAVSSGQQPHFREFIEVPFKKADSDNHLLIAQIELLVGEGVKIGSATAQGKISILGIGADIVATQDVEETRVRVTAKIIAFIDPLGKVTSHETTIEYIGRPVYRAKDENLRKIFSALNNSTTAALEIGTVLGAPRAIPVVLDPTGFMRHTAVFGQSGSGKSFSFGIVLEELLLKTDARILVLDPNSDYCNFRQLRRVEDVCKDSRREYSSSDHAVVETAWQGMSGQFLRFTRDPTRDGDNKLSLLFSDLRRQEQGDLLGLDPIADAQDYRVFRETIETLGGSYTLQRLMDAVSKPGSMEKFNLLNRISNREIDKLGLWSTPSAVDRLKEDDWKFASFDLRDLWPLERSLVSSAVLKAVYDGVIKSRKVTFIVIDEAHNLCPAVPWAWHQNAPLQILLEIAAEGRKYGAFLMLLTQNPSKLSQQALIQFDNIILMRMVSGAEIQALGAIIPDAGPNLAQKAFTLGKGEAICMGGIVKNETNVKFDLRKTQPGGDDVSKGWAAHRPLVSAPPATPLAAGAAV